jgi:hypothetical protein
MKAKGKIAMLVNVYANNDSITNLMQILDADITIVKQCTIELSKRNQARYEYYLQQELYNSALAIKSKLKRLNELLQVIENPTLAYS